MVELPRYVHRVTKKRKGGAETVYTFYTRGRNTAEAWPSIRMPEPLEPEFAGAVAICDALSYADGRFSLFGVDLPDLKADDFWPVARKAWEAKQRRDHADAKDFTALVDAFKDSEAYKTLAKSTRRGYDYSAEMIIAAWGADQPGELTTVDAQIVIDGLGDTPATANQFRAFGSRLMAWGIPRGFNVANPFEHTEKVPGGEPWKPWPDWAFETLFEHAPFNLLMPAVSALFTGQRQVDVLAMPKVKKAQRLMEVTAQKTKTTVWIPVHTAYRHWIDIADDLATAAAVARAKPGEAVVEHTMMHLGVRGAPYSTTDGFRSEWQRLMDTTPFKRFREERIVFHGLRKNAVVNLLEVGCTETMVGSIANMSEQMVRHYGREVSTRRLAEEAMKLLEEKWDSVRPTAFAEQEQNGNWKPSIRIGNRWEGAHRAPKA